MRAVFALVFTASLFHCGPGFEAWPVAVVAERAHPCPLPEDPRTRRADLDRDGDCLDDEAEHAIASWFVPWFQFDSRENARKLNEPVVLYQVHHLGGCDRSRGPNGGDEIEVRWVYLFAEDGGYATSPVCRDTHHGDNQYVQATLRLQQHPFRAELEAVKIWGFSWPRHNFTLAEGQHLIVQLSAGKHHPYPDLRANGQPSPYSMWACIDAVDGAGALVVPSLELPGAPRGANNVGERTQHPTEAFVVDMTSFGFPGENTWGTDPFCGARPREGCSTGVNPMSGVWR